MADAMNNMIFNFEERPTDSPWIHTIWRNHCENGGDFTSMAINQWGMVITRHQGKTAITVRGPETKASPAYCPPGAEHFGVIFKLGTFMRIFPASRMQDQSVTLPEALGHSFWLNGSSWQYPSYENIEGFVDKLVHEDLLSHEPIVDAALKGEPVKETVRSVQRRFLHATGLTRGTVVQIERARYAAFLLQQNVPILDVVFDAGYTDQPHLTRSLKYFVGMTPAQINSQQLSLLFNTTLFA